MDAIHIFLGEEAEAQGILRNKISITQIIEDGSKIWLQLSLATKVLFFYHIKALTFLPCSPGAIVDGQG